MKLTALIFTFWIITWTQTRAHMEKFTDNWYCTDEQHSELYNDEMTAASRAAVLKTDGYKNVEVFRAEPVKVSK